MTEREIVLTLFVLVLSLLSMIGKKDKTAGLWIMLLVIANLLMSVIDRLQMIVDGMG